MKIPGGIGYPPLFDRKARLNKFGVEAPGGIEPPHRSFADCSLNHLGTAPCVWIIEGKGQPDKEGNAVQGLRLKQRNLLLT